MPKHPGPDSLFLLLDHSSRQTGEGEVPGQLWVCPVVQEVLWCKLRWKGVWPGWGEAGPGCNAHTQQCHVSSHQNPQKGSQSRSGCWLVLWFEIKVLGFSLVHILPLVASSAPQRPPVAKVAPKLALVSARKPKMGGGGGGGDEERAELMNEVGTTKHRGRNPPITIENWHVLLLQEVNELQ